MLNCFLTHSQSNLLFVSSCDVREPESPRASSTSYNITPPLELTVMFSSSSVLHYEQCEHYICARKKKKNVSDIYFYIVVFM